jgi:hypothetical protein
MKKALLITSLLAIAATAYAAGGDKGAPTIASPEPAPPKTYSCNGFSMVAEGDMICQYFDGYDNKTRYVYATISEDTVVYTIFRETQDKTPDMLKKWKVYIGIVAGGSPYFDVFDWMNGDEKIYRVTLPVLSGHNYYFEEFFCASSTEPKYISANNNLEMSFTTEAAARAFHAKVKAIRETIETPDPNAPAKSSGGSEKLSGKVKIINKTGGEAYIKVEGSSAMHKIQPNASHDVQCSSYGGKKVWLTNKDQKVLQTLFTVTEDVCKKGEYVLGK